jgi:hypothetical protein
MAEEDVIELPLEVSQEITLQRIVSDIAVQPLLRKLAVTSLNSSVFTMLVLPSAVAVRPTKPHLYADP